MQYRVIEWCDFNSPEIWGESRVYVSVGDIVVGMDNAIGTAVVCRVLEVVDSHARLEVVESDAADAYLRYVSGTPLQSVAHDGYRDAFNAGWDSGRSDVT